MDNWNEVWARLRDGQHAVLCGVGPIPEPDLSRLRLIWVDCEAHPEPLGTLEEALRRIDRELGINPWVDLAAQRVLSALRRRLLGDEPLDIDAARYERALRRAAPAGRGPRPVLLLSGLERADTASLERLTRAFAGDHPPLWPLLLRFDGRQPSGAARELLERLQRALPADAFWWGPQASFRQPEPAALGERLTSLSTEALRVLRAAATIGDRFEVETVAQLLELEELAVLDAIQQAIDLGLKIEDRGRGVFRFEASVAASLRRATLPALSRAWHWRLAELFGGLPAPPAATSVPAQSGLEARPVAGAQRAASQVDAQELGAAQGFASAAAAGTPIAADEVLQVPAGAASPEELRPASWWQRLEAASNAAAATPAATAATAVSAAAPPEPSLRAPEAGDQRRAAGHAEAAGFHDEACEHYLAVASDGALAGHHARALDAATRALALAERVPEPHGRLLAARALLLIGRCRWLARGTEETSLEQAIEALERSRDRLSSEPQPELAAELAATMANVWYDVGTPRALERALVEITRASHSWLEAGHPLNAARLLNDEAAIWVKLGNPVRANQLLLRSRQVFGSLASAHPEARLELLETEHLLARLMLQAAARPGLEREALQLGMQHALAAEAGYRALADRWQLCRVWETMGRLELKLGQLGAARERLQRAHAEQLELGDAIGAARSAGAIGEVYAAAEDYPRALESLEQSVALNAEKGSGAGLQFNLASLRALEGRLPDGLAETARKLGLHIVRALGVT